MLALPLPCGPVVDHRTPRGFFGLRWLSWDRMLARTVTILDIARM